MSHDVRYKEGLLYRCLYVLVCVRVGLLVGAEVSKWTRISQMT